MQTQNRLFDDLARVITGAAGAAQGVGDELRAIVRSQVERLVADMDMVPREEFEAVRELAAAARTEADDLKARVEALEAKLAEPGAAAKKPAKKAAAKAGSAAKTGGAPAA